MKGTLVVTKKELEKIVAAGGYACDTMAIVPFTNENENYFHVFHSEGGEIILCGEGYMACSLKENKATMKEYAKPNCTLNKK